MSIYINKEDLLKLCHYDDFDKSVIDLEDIEKIKPVDVIERRCGKWIYLNTTLTDGSIYPIFLYCSECNFVCYSETNFCPNCGAEMEKGDSDV